LLSLTTNELHGAETFIPKPIVLELVKKFPSFMEPDRFVTVFTKASQ